MLNICLFPHIFGSPSSDMTLQLLHFWISFYMRKIWFSFFISEAKRGLGFCQSRAQSYCCYRERRLVVQHSTYERGSSNWHYVANTRYSSHLFIIVCLYRSPIALGRKGVFSCSNCFYLHSRRLQEEKGGYSTLLSRAICPFTVQCCLGKVFRRTVQDCPLSPIYSYS